MIFKIKSIIGAILALLFNVASISDYFSVNENPVEYQMVYHFSENSEHWTYQSIENYKIQSLIYAFIYFVYFVLNILFLIKNTNYLKYILVLIEILLILWLFVSIYQWSLTGFDH
jgi:hypothetical protein